MRLEPKEREALQYAEELARMSCRRLELLQHRRVLLQRQPPGASVGQVPSLDGGSPQEEAELGDAEAELGDAVLAGLCSAHGEAEEARLHVGAPLSVEADGVGELAVGSGPPPVEWAEGPGGVGADGDGPVEGLRDGDALGGHMHQQRDGVAAEAKELPHRPVQRVDGDGMGCSGPEEVCMCSVVHVRGREGGGGRYSPNIIRTDALYCGLGSAVCFVPHRQ